MSCLLFGNTVFMRRGSTSFMAVFGFLLFPLCDLTLFPVLLFLFPLPFRSLLQNIRLFSSSLAPPQVMFPFHRQALLLFCAIAGHSCLLLGISLYSPFFLPSLTKTHPCFSLAGKALSRVCCRSSFSTTKSLDTNPFFSPPRPAGFVFHP